MAATVDARTCGSCCLKLKELVSNYEDELGLKGKEFDGTKSKCPSELHVNAFRLKCMFLLRVYIYFSNR